MLQSPDWRFEEDDRQVATCSQLGSTSRLEHARTCASSTGDSLISGEVSYTCWMLSTRFGSEFASWCSDVCTRWLLNTCLPTANPSPASPAVAACFVRRTSFAYAGPSNWNSLPAYLRDSSLSLSSFKHHLRTFSSLSTRLAHSSCLGFFYKKCTI